MSLVDYRLLFDHMHAKYSIENFPAQEHDRLKIRIAACFRTALPAVYAGGDCVAPGQDLTVQAVQHGKLAALSIHNDILSKAEAAWPT